MINIASGHTSSSLASAFNAAMDTSQPVWPTHEEPGYGLTRTSSSYSEISNQVMNAEVQYPHSDFFRDLAAIYESLGKRQIRLGMEIDSAIFDNLDSLYES